MKYHWLVAIPIPCSTILAGPMLQYHYFHFAAAGMFKSFCVPCNIQCSGKMHTLNIMLFSLLLEEIQNRFVYYANCDIVFAVKYIICFVFHFAIWGDSEQVCFLCKLWHFMQRNTFNIVLVHFAILSTIMPWLFAIQIVMFHKV